MLCCVSVWCMLDWVVLLEKIGMFKVRLMLLVCVFGDSDLVLVLLF